MNNKQTRQAAAYVTNARREVTSCGLGVNKSHDILKQMEGGQAKAGRERLGRAHQ